MRRVVIGKDEKDVWPIIATCDGAQHQQDKNGLGQHAVHRKELHKEEK
jgi:hypothetical protein